MTAEMLQAKIHKGPYPRGQLLAAGVVDKKLPAFHHIFREKHFELPCLERVKR